MKRAHEWYTFGFGEAILPPPVFPNWVLPNEGPSGHAADKPEIPKSHGATEDAAAPNSTKFAATSKGKGVMLDSDEDDVTFNPNAEVESSESKDSGNSSSSSPLS